MSKHPARTAYFCQQCGTESPKWLGRCPSCGEWNTYVEMRTERAQRHSPWAEGAPAQPLELSALGSEREDRLTLPFGELNRVLGGGVVKGSIVLLAGDPGIGKSTLLLQSAAGVASQGDRVLYVSGEESGRQVRLRAQRLGIEGKGLFFVAETVIESVLRHLERLSSSLVVVDSIQTLYAEEVPSGAGSVAQVRECTRLLTQWAKEQEVPVLMAGHVTKDGTVAGPRVLEHMVDVVLYLEGDPSGLFRILRGTKNRFGATNDVAVFQMGGRGLEEVADPSWAFIGQRQAGGPGSAVVVTLEGTRPLVAEVQALTTPSIFNPPRRTGNGVDFQRLILVTAVLGKRAGLSLGSQDVIVNVAGGLRIGEPAADLSIALALASSLHDVALDPSCVFMGEVGLSGELRGVPQVERRLREAAKLGFSRAIVPVFGGEGLAPVEGIQPMPATTLREALRLALPRRRSGGPQGLAGT